MTYYNYLQLKHIQHDTLSHFLLSRISTLYPDQTVLQHIALGRYIYPSSEEEIPPQIFNSFMQGSYHNVHDFWDLWMKLRHSLTRAMLSREREFIARLYEESEPLEEITGLFECEFY